MSADDQTFLDTLNSVGTDVRQYSDNAAAWIESGVDKAAAILRDTLSSQSWIPTSVKPRAPIRPLPPAEIHTMALYSRVNQWVLNNRLLTGTFVLGIAATTAGLVSRSRRHYSKKRRARRAENHARIEVVVLTGSFSDPILRSLALDLERRGFIVYIACVDEEGESSVLNEGRSNIIPLAFDLSRPESSIELFKSLLQKPQYTSQDAQPHHLVLSSLIVVPSSTYPEAPLATLPSSATINTVYTHVNQPIMIVQAFLPLLASAWPDSTALEATRPKPKVLILTPSVVSSVNPPFHILESTVVAALTTFTQALTSELAPLGIPVTHIKMGVFDLSSVQVDRKRGLQAYHSDIYGWSKEARALYAANYCRRTDLMNTDTRRGSPLRELHNVVFDTIEQKPTRWGSDTGNILRVGRGSTKYEILAMFAPRNLVCWMMGTRSLSQNDRLDMGENFEDLSGSSGSLVHLQSEYVSELRNQEQSSEMKDRNMEWLDHLERSHD